jgi:hypothetical protein
MPRAAQKKPHANSDASNAADSYDRFKTYEGQRYTGMKIGRSHKWYYDQGEWKEKKITPDLWEISYAVTKRRAGKAPEGSGVPVGTEYHWYILAHQHVRKLNANDYTTSLAGLKFKVAHRRADSGKWSASPKAERRRMIKFLRGVIADLENANDADTDAALQETAGPTPRASRPAKGGRKGAKKASAPPSVMKRGWKSRTRRKRSTSGR